MRSSEKVREKLGLLARNRILILDGAMGSMIQAHISASGESLEGCNDMLCLTRPELISGIHEAYLKAGADIITTCSFNSTAISLADYGLAQAAYEVSAAAGRLARGAADAYSTPDKPRFVAGSLGPTAKSASIAPDLDDPGKRSVSWDELQAAYYDNARGLLDGGADIILIETIFDTLNAKAAIFAARRLAQERGIDLPLFISATVSDKGGRLLSGQSAEAFCISVLHAQPAALGLNCSFGAEKLKPYIAALSAAAAYGSVPCLISAYPNAGFPNRFGAYDESPESMGEQLEDYMRQGLVNIAGGCCGSTPAHIAAIAARAKNYAPRPLPAPALKKKAMLAGLNILELSREDDLAGINEHRKRFPRRDEFKRLLTERDYDGAVDLVRESVEEGAALIDICIDDTVPDAKTALSSFLNLALQYPDIARLPVLLSGSCHDLTEAGLKCIQGKALVSTAGCTQEEGGLSSLARLARAYGAAIAASPNHHKFLTDSGFPPEDIFHL